MSRFLKILAILSLIVALAPVFALLAYDVLAVRPHLPEIRAALYHADPEERHPPPLLVELLRAEDPSTVRYSLVQTLVWKIHGNERTSNLWRHGRGLLWTFFLWLHFSEEERDGLYCSQIYVGSDQVGLAAASKELFDRPLSELSIEELASIVSIPWQPLTYRKAPEKLLERRDWLLARYHAARAARSEAGK